MDNKRQFIRKYLIVLLGIALTAFAISVFYTPNKIVNGGVSGIATIFFHTLKIPTGITFFVINIILLLTALKILGKRFVIDTVIATVVLSLLLQVFSHIAPFMNDIVLTTIFGSVLYGIGIGLALSQGASTGGTDILGRIVQYFFRKFGLEHCCL